MATIANWNGHTFVVSPGLIRGFTGLTVEGACETTTKNRDKQKYEERKYGEAPKIGMTIGLSALTGVTDVFGEAMTWVSEAQKGATAYFYMGSRKLIPAKVILVSAKVSEVEMTGNGSQWISCNVDVAFRQGAKNDGSGNGVGSGGGGGSQKASVKTTGLKQSAVSAAAAAAVVSGLAAVKGVEVAAKAASSGSRKPAGLAYQSSLVAKARALSLASTALKKAATKGRTEITTSKKITGAAPSRNVSMK